VRAPKAFRVDPALVVLLVAMTAAAIGACRRTVRAPTRFPHEMHLTLATCRTPGAAGCLSCTSCHQRADLGGDHARPGTESCEGCHQQDLHEVAAVLGHEPARPSGEISFDHDFHLALDGLRGQCVPCHAGVVEAGRPSLPPMSQCFGCHEHAEEWARGECTPCHTQRDLARTLPVTFLRHDAAFMKNHGSKFAQEQQGLLCRACHTESECQTCHDLTQGLTVEARRPERIEAGQVHRGDFMVRHAIEARSQPARCLSCHTESTCDGCHVARGVSANAIDPLNPHPPGWVGNASGSNDFHGTAARRDIVACAGCHEAGPATNCIRCHRVGGFGGNPHPNGWQSARSTGSEMCGYCHG
jgi:hypothetical protein